MNFSKNEIYATAIAASFVGNRELEASGVDQGLIDASTNREYRGATFHSLYDAWCAARNMTTNRTATEKADGFIRAAAGGEMMAAAGFSTLNLGSIMDDAVNKVVRVKFLSIPSVIPAVCKQIDTPDFKPIHNYQITSGTFLQKVTESGELAHARISEGASSYSVDDSGAYLSIPRKYVVNDDMKIIAALGDLLGLRGRQSLERDFHLMVLNAGWSAKNQITGVGSAFGYAAMKLAHQKWADQESDGAPIAVGPSVLLVQSGSMELDAKDLNKSEKVMVRSDNTVDRTEGNVFRGMLNNVVGTPWLRHKTMGAKASSTAWLTLSDPTVHSMFEVAYLGGPDGEGRVPRVETAQMPFTSLGLQMRVLFSYGMAQTDDVGGVLATGVAE